MTAGAIRTPTLLVAEDNDRAREALATLLRRRGYTVTPASDGRRALDLLRAGPVPDLILLDMLMPVLDGWHFLQQVKGEPRLAQVPVVVVTGTILTPDWARDHGCAGFARKPVEPEELLAEIRRVLR
jgi:CheY-like chemotaxis protein